MRHRRHTLVLSIYLNTRGFAFVLFEGSLAPFDWAAQTIRGRRKHARCLLRIAALLNRYEPDVIVLQDMARASNRRAMRLISLNAEIDAMAQERGVPVFAYSRADVDNAFAPFGLGNKHDMAELIAKHAPAFERFVPPPRKPWMSEDARMGIFDAAALGFVFYQREGSE